MIVKVKIKVSTLSEVLEILETLDTDSVKENHPNVNLTIRVADDTD